jgi:phage shock protein C
MAELKRNTNDALIAGVCSGLADWIGTSPAIIRLAFLLAFIFFGAGPLIYLILWILMPKA